MTDEKPKEEKEETPKEEKAEKQPKEEKIEEQAKTEEAKPKEEPKKEKPVKREYKLNTSSEKKNPLIKRIEYMINVVHGAQATPTRTDLTKEIAKVLKVNEDVILIEKIFSECGKAESVAKVFVYKDKKEIPKYKLDKIEKRTNKKKKE
ncbi:MAG: hypothetical protein KJ613_01260 [Nanoarchaeota archaeon]|nr:hypothetical protein [Nanoarchaeota archaeon]